MKNVVELLKELGTSPGRTITLRTCEDGYVELVMSEGIYHHAMKIHPDDLTWDPMPHLRRLDEMLTAYINEKE